MLGPEFWVLLHGDDNEGGWLSRSWLVVMDGGSWLVARGSWLVIEFIFIIQVLPSSPRSCLHLAWTGWDPLLISSLQPFLVPGEAASSVLSTDRGQLSNFNHIIESVGLLRITLFIRVYPQAQMVSSYVRMTKNTKTCPIE